MDHPRLALVRAVLFAACLAPLASAGPITEQYLCHEVGPVRACAFDHTVESGCASYGATGASARVLQGGIRGGAFAQGYDIGSCEGTSFNTITAGVWTSMNVGVGVAWVEGDHAGSHFCLLYAYGFTPVTPFIVPLGCVAGDPPHPAWGTLLP